MAFDISYHIHNLKASWFLTPIRAQPSFVQPLCISSYFSKLCIEQ